MQFIFVRHAQSEANVSSVVQGQMDSPLTSLGVEQAQHLARRLESVPIHFAYSSDLSRARDTLNEILVYHPAVPKELRCDLREQYKGDWEGRAARERNVHLASLGMPYRDFDYDGAEDMHAVWERSVAFYEEIREKHGQDDTVLVVTHGGVLACIIPYLRGFSITDPYVQAKNTSVSIYGIDSSGLAQEKLVNCVAHLL